MSALHEVWFPRKYVRVPFIKILKCVLIKHWKYSFRRNYIRNLRPGIWSLLYLYEKKPGFNHFEVIFWIFFFSVSLSCGSTTAQNCTYLVQEATTSPASNPCIFTICKESDDICRIRLDFTVRNCLSKVNVSLKFNSGSESLKMGAMFFCVYFQGPSKAFEETQWFIKIPNKYYSQNQVTIQRDESNMLRQCYVILRDL